MTWAKQKHLLKNKINDCICFHLAMISVCVVFLLFILFYYLFKRKPHTEVDWLFLNIFLAIKKVSIWEKTATLIQFISQDVAESFFQFISHLQKNSIGTLWERKKVMTFTLTSVTLSIFWLTNYVKKWTHFSASFAAHDGKDAHADFKKGNFC